MSTIFSGLSRDERLLPITDHQTLVATGDYRVLFLSEETHPALHGHVEHYWRQQRTTQQTQQQYMHTVLRSTKVPVRRIPFPDTRRRPLPSSAATGTATVSSSPAPAIETRGEVTHKTEAHQTSSSSSSSSSMTPSLLAAQQAVQLLSPYERLVWPSLLQSPLMVPWVAESVSSPAAAPPQPPSLTPVRCDESGESESDIAWQSRFYNTRMSWPVSVSSALSQSTLQSLSQLAAQHSMPAQETMLLYSLALTYFDVVVPSGVPAHALLWNDSRGAGLGAEDMPHDARRVLWFQQCLLQTGVEKSGTLSSCGAEVSMTPSGDDQTRSARARLRQTGLPDDDDVPAIETPTTFQAMQGRLAHVLAFFQMAASSLDSQQTAPPSATALSQLAAGNASATTTTTAFSSSPMPPAGSQTGLSSPPKHLAFLVVKLAAQHWLERRGATVSATKVLGCSATAHTVRDLLATSEAQAPSEGATKEVSDGGGESGLGATQDTAPLPRTGPHVPQLPRRTAGEADEEEVCFKPCEPRGLCREESAFALSPLPCDPVIVFSVPVSHAVLMACLRDPRLILTLREKLLVEAGAQCAALVTLRRAQAQLNRVPSVPTVRMSGSREVSATSTHASSSLLLRSRSDMSLTGRTAPMQEAQTLTPPPPTTPSTELLQSLVFPLLTADPMSSSYAIYGPQAATSALEMTSSGPGTGWQWNDSVGWKGFTGWLLRCYDDAQSSTTSPKAKYASAALERVRFADAGLSLTLPHLPVSMEELADLCCRLGARLPRLSHARRPPLLQLSKPLHLWVLGVFEKHLFDIYLLCRQQRVQAFHLRASSRGVALTLLQGDGKEEKVGSPGELSAEAHAAAASALAGADNGAAAFTPAALQLVAESGFDDAALWLSHLVAHCHERRGALRIFEWLDRTRLVSGPRSQSEEEGAPHAVFAPTPPSGPVSGPAAAAAAATSRETTPKTMTTSVSRVAVMPQGALCRVQTVSLRRAEESVLLRILRCHPAAVYLAGCGVQQVMLEAKTGRLVLQRRCCGEIIPWELRDCYELKIAGHPLRTPLHSVSTHLERPLPLPQGVPDAGMRVDLNQMKGMLQYYHRSILSSLKKEERQQLLKTRAATAAHTESDAGPCADDKPTKDCASPEVAAARCQPVPVFNTPAHLSTLQWPEAQRTVLFPTDRAIALYVLRHHPQYYTSVRGCGVVDVYVACVPEMGNERADGAAVPDTTTPPSDTTRLGGVTLSSPTSRSAALPSTPQLAAKATFLIERACGTLVPVSLESCYYARAPHDLLPPQQLVEMDRAALSYSVLTSQRSDRTYESSLNASQASSSPSGAGSKRLRPW